MARTTKPLSGSGKDKFLRGLVASVGGVPAKAAGELTKQLTSNITEVRVRREAWEQVSGRAIEPDVEADVAATLAPAVSAPVPSASLPSATDFDPFAFSAIAMLTRKGKAALAAELEKIASIENLHKLAAAQHLSLDPKQTDMAALRADIVTAVERRIAERKAAAS